MPTKSKLGKLKYNNRYDTLLVEHMKRGLSFWSFAATAMVGTSTMDEWLKEYPSFRHAREVGEEYYRQFWETAYIKGITGDLPRQVKTITRYDANGKPIGAMKVEEPIKFSPQAIQFILRNRYPDQWKEHSEVTIANKPQTEEELISEWQSDNEKLKRALERRESRRNREGKE